MKCKINNDVSLGVCYCPLCAKSGGKIQVKDDKTKIIYVRSGKWLFDKIKEEAEKKK